MKKYYLGFSIILIFMPQVSFGANQNPVGAVQIPVVADPQQVAYQNAQVACLQQEGQDRALWIKNNAAVLANQDKLVQAWIAAGQQARKMGQPVPQGPIPEDPAFTAFKNGQFAKKTACLNQAAQQLKASQANPG